MFASEMISTKATNLQKVLYVIGKARYAKVAALITGMVVIAGFEAAALAGFLPFLQLLSDPKQTPLSQGWLPEFFLNFNYLGQIQFASFLLLLLFAFKNGFVIVLNEFKFRFLYQTQAEVAQSLLSKYLHATLEFHMDTNSAVLIRATTTDVRMAFGFVLAPIMLVITEGFIVLAIGGLLMLLNPLIAIIASSVLLFTGFLFVRAIRRRTLQLGRQQQTEFGEMIRLVSESLISVAEIKVSNSQEYFERKFRTRVDAYTNSLERYQFFQELTRPTIEMVGVGSMLIAVFLAVTLLESRELIPLLGIFGLAVVRLGPSGTRIVASLTSIRHHFPSMEVLYEAISKPENLQSLDGPTLDVEQEIEVLNLSFGYTTTEVLKDISIKISPGKSLALVGESGSGKSTLIKLIMGLLNPTKGSICSGGIPIQHSLQQWQSHLGYVPQSVRLIDDSIRQNIAFGQNEPDDDLVWKCCAIAGIRDFVSELPEGLETSVGELGDRLSGGQRQRIGIARALYRDPKVLIFDEATSALDNETERQINDSLEGIRASGITSIIVAHRLSSIRHCDQIVVIDKGMIEAKGTYDQLVESSIKFQQLVEKSQQEEHSEG